jgi:hypothetical protein
MVTGLFAGAPPTREAARRRLEDFLSRAAGYAERRGYVEPPDHANVSGLSPWVTRRLLREEEIVAATLARWGAAPAEKFLQETCWRTYWKGWLEHSPATWDLWWAAVPRIREALHGQQSADYGAAIRGETDIECFNIWVRDLLATGWLHNHARMWFASIWIFTLRLPWELGAAFFFEHLLDGDPASNTLSWRWVAGLHTPGKTYLARADNIARYAPHLPAPPPGRLAQEAFALPAPPVPRCPPASRPRSWREAGARAAPGGARLGLWLHPEDSSPEVGELADAPVAAIFAAWPRGLRERAGWAPVVETWTRAALVDGAARAAAHFGRVPAAEEHADFVGALAGWAREERLDGVLAYEPAQGPWRTIARELDRRLEADGVTIHWIRRAWDDELWPHASRGFFPFWTAVKRGRGLA